MVKSPVTEDVLKKYLNFKDTDEEIAEWVKNYEGQTINMKIYGEIK